MVVTGLQKILNNFPAQLTNKRIGVLCHAASITSDYVHIVDALKEMPCTVAAIFGPQHGLYGQTQDNMVEWESHEHDSLRIPVYSLYGQTRKPTPEMLDGLDTLIIDLQDVGARPYTYVWTIKLCLEACADRGVAVWVLDRPNPIGACPIDGPMLNGSYFSFVGGACIPLCHRLTLGELAMLLKQDYFPDIDLNVVWMDGWWRNSLWYDTGLPWVLPSPNMPTVETAIVYPGMVLLEATNVSEGRGTTRPFELIGAPFVNHSAVRKKLSATPLAGCTIREHNFIPTFQKWSGTFCNGLYVHVTNARTFRPVLSTAMLLWAIRATAPDAFRFKDPPYEYEVNKMPFDILAGDEHLRHEIENGFDARQLIEQWQNDYIPFLQKLPKISHYPEEKS